jgi:death-on-curing protein
MLTFLEMNGIKIQCSDEELVEVGLGVADGSIGYEELVSWIREHE